MTDLSDLFEGLPTWAREKWTVKSGEGFGLARVILDDDDFRATGGALTTGIAEMLQGADGELAAYIAALHNQYLVGRD